MVMESHPLARDELVRVLTSYTGATTADGAADGSTLIDSNLIGANDFVFGKTILIVSGPARREDRGASAFNPATGQITVESGFNSQITQGTIFRIVNISSVEVDVKNIIAVLAGAQGLAYRGVVTDVPAADQFTIATLAGLGAGKFSQVGGVSQYYAYVSREHTGASAAPQGESQIITGYATVTGNFVANPFTVDVDIGDEILIIHPFLARIMNFAGLPPHEGSIAANWSTAGGAHGTSGEEGEDLIGGASAAPAIGAATTRYKLHSLLLDVSALTDGAVIHVKLFMKIAGAVRKIYDQHFTVPTTAGTETPPPDTDGLWIVNGTLVIHDLLRVEVHSTINENVPIGFTYILEAM